MVEERRPSYNPWLIAVSVMLATFMEVLDTSVASVALPHMAGSLSASVDEATWVLTGCLISNAIVLPSTGWLSSYFGRKQYQIISIAIFAASALCGASTSLPMLVTARVIQGAAGGGLQPVSQAVLPESFPREKHGMAMAVYGVGIMMTSACSASSRSAACRFCCCFGRDWSASTSRERIEALQRPLRRRPNHDPLDFTRVQNIGIKASDDLRLRRLLCGLAKKL